MPSESVMAVIAGGSQPDTRPRLTYTVPEADRQYETDPRKLTFAPIRIQDELDAISVAESKGGRGLNYELVRRSVVAVDGAPVNWDKNEDAWLDRASPKVRALALLAFRDVNEPVESDARGFLASRAAAV